MFPARSSSSYFAALAFALALASCGQSEQVAEETGPAKQTSASADGVWGNEGRDRLCLKGDRAGLVVYAGEGDTNCTARGVLERAGDLRRVRPDGDASCVIEVRPDGSALVLGQVSPACAYYCGPKANFAGKRLEPKPPTEAVVDLAGDPLC